MVHSILRRESQFFVSQLFTMSEFKQLTTEEIAADQAVNDAIAEVEQHAETSSLTTAFESLVVDGVEESKRYILFISLYTITNFLF